MFNRDGTVSYLNPAFERVFGWTLDELKGRRIAFVPSEEKEKTRKGIAQLYRDKRIYGFETRRLTKDGRVLDIVLDGALFYDDDNLPAGQLVTLRDVTEQKRTARINQTVFRIAQALYRFTGLDARLEYITKEVQNLISIEGAMVILLDEEKKQFFFRMASLENSETEQKIREIRFPADKGVAGQVYRTGKPLIVPDVSQSPYFFKQVDDKSGLRTRSMLDVPIQIQDRMIGVLCVVNKKNGMFDQTDVDLLSAVANMVALPIENARINEALRRSFENVKSLNRAKDSVIHHLSHELKTPVSVLSAALKLIRRRHIDPSDPAAAALLDRAQRSVQRLLDMQYQIEDIIQERDYKSHRMLSLLLKMCSDALTSLVDVESGDSGLADRVRSKIDALFGPREAPLRVIAPGPFIARHFEDLKPRFAHRRCRITTLFEKTDPILIPAEVLAKISEGLIRNAIENTPDGARIDIRVAQGDKGPEFMVRDFGVGITEENQRLIFENFFTTYETLDYASKKPYDFGAGGKGFDLIRLKIFSERYHFRLAMSSKRCLRLPQHNSAGTAADGQARPCGKDDACLSSGGTTMTIFFPPAHESPLFNRIEA